jgi:hypothetical protein
MQSQDTPSHRPPPMHHPHEQLNSCNTSSEDEFTLVKGKGTSKLSSAAKCSLKLSNRFELSPKEEHEVFEKVGMDEGAIDDGRRQDKAEGNLIEDLKDTILSEGGQLYQNEGNLIQDGMNISLNKEEERCDNNTESFIDNLLQEIIQKTVKQSKARKQKQRKRMAEESETCSNNVDINNIDGSNVIEDKIESTQQRIRCRNCQITHFPYQESPALSRTFNNF